MIVTLIPALYLNKLKREKEAKNLNIVGNVVEKNYRDEDIDTTRLDEVTSASVIPENIIRKYTPRGFTDSEKKKAIVVLGEPRKNSITYDMAYTTMENLEENGVEVELRDLYSMNFNPVLTLDEFYYQKDGLGEPKEDVRIEQELITQADYIIFIYPNWHDTETAIIKGYKERVFAKNFAYEYTSNGHRGLLEGKGIYTIMNCGFLGGGRGFIGDGVGISDEKWDDYMKAFKHLDDDTANWWGASNYGRFVNDRSPENKMQNYREEIEKLRGDLEKNINKIFLRQ